MMFIRENRNFISGVLFSTFMLVWFVPIVVSAQTLKKSQEVLQVSITTHLGNDQIFLAGDKISFYVSLNKPAFLTLLYKDATGKVLQILPNHNSTMNKYPQGAFLSVPKDDASFELVVQPTFGEEQAWIVASDKPLSASSGMQLGNGLRLLKGSIQEVIDNLGLEATRKRISYSHAYVDLITRAELL